MLLGVGDAHEAFSIHIIHYFPAPYHTLTLSLAIIVSYEKVSEILDVPRMLRKRN